MFQFFQVAIQTGGMQAKNCHTRDQTTCTTAFMWLEDYRQVWMHSTTLNTTLCATVGLAFPQHLTPGQITPLAHSACIILVYLTIIILPKTVQL